MLPSPSTELIFERSLPKTAALLAGSIVMAGLSYYCLRRGVLRFAWEGWLLGITLGGVAIGINIVALFRGGPQVIFNEHGIHDLRTSWGMISWGEIDSVAIVSIYCNRMLCLYLVDEPARVARLSLWGRIALRANHMKGFPAFKLRFAGLTPGLDAAWDYLLTHHPQEALPVAHSTSIAEGP